MNPDQLFDYLDGKLPEHARHELEGRLLNDPQLQRELDVARRIHAGLRRSSSEHREIIGELSEPSARGRRLGRQVLLAAMVLVAMNVFLGLLYIARHESKNPNRAALENQTREHLRQALEKAAGSTLTPPPIGVVELRVAVVNGRTDSVANDIVKAAGRLNGMATKGVADQGRIQVLVEIPERRALELKSALTNLGSVTPSDAPFVPGETDQKMSILVQVMEAK